MPKHLSVLPSRSKPLHFENHSTSYTQCPNYNSNQNSMDYISKHPDKHSQPPYTSPSEPKYPQEARLPYISPVSCEANS